MRQLWSNLLTVGRPFAASRRAATQSDIPSPTKRSGNQKAAINVPAGPKSHLALTSPVWARSARVETDPFGTSFQWPSAIRCDSAGTTSRARLTPKRPVGSQISEFQFHFTKLVFANGYTVELRSR